MYLMTGQRVRSIVRALAPERWSGWYVWRGERERIKEEGGEGGADSSRRRDDIRNPLSLRGSFVEHD